MKKIIVGVVFLCLPFVSFAQWNDCVHGKTDGSCEYPGECGRYTDTNDDKICDHSQEEPVAGSTIKNQNEKIIVENDVSGKNIKNDREGVIGDNDDLSGDSKMVVGASGDLNGDGDVVDSQKVVFGDKKVKQYQDKYPLWNIALGLSIFYTLTYFLAKKKVVKMVTHKKIWNILLTVSFLALTVTSILLIIQINSGKVFSLGFNILYWHVITGIIMMVITLFHMGWHWRYYKNLLVK